MFTSSRVKSIYEMSFDGPVLAEIHDVRPLNRMHVLSSNQPTAVLTGRVGKLARRWA